MPAQTVDATLACSLLAGVWKPKVFLGRRFKDSATWSSFCLQHNLLVYAAHARGSVRIW
jgi:hypothetical protein